MLHLQYTKTENMTSLIKEIEKHLSNGTDIAFNEYCVFAKEDNTIVMTVVTKIDQPVKQIVLINGEVITDTTGLTEQQLLKLL